MLKETRYMEAFVVLGKSEDISNSPEAGMKAFACVLYGCATVDSVDDARSEVFLRQFTPRSKSKPLDKIKGADYSGFLPFPDVLKQNILRPNLSAYMLKHVNKAVSLEINPHHN